MGYLVIARRNLPAQLKPLECQLARQHRHDRVVPQIVMVADVFVAQRNPEHPLRNERRNKVLDQFRFAPVNEACSKALNQPDRTIVAPNSSAPASDVIAPPSNPATTARRSTGANSNSSALHSVGIGVPLESWKVVVAQLLSLIRCPDAPI